MDLKEKIRTIIAEEVEVPVSEISNEKDLEELGVDSLAIASILSRVDAELDVELDIEELFSEDASYTVELLIDQIIKNIELIKK